MPAIPRKTILEKFHAMIAAGKPIVGGGAGTGISAKAEEAGGIDLIIIYNSGRYRMAGRGSAAGLLAYGNANQIVKEMAVEVLPVVKHTPVLAGVNGTDPFIQIHGLFRCAEFPDHRPVRRPDAAEFRGDRHELQSGSRHDIGGAQARLADDALCLQPG
jgi:predicted TIM-barrel enzyme